MHDALNTDLKGNMKSIIITYRYSVTGEWGYAYYAGKQPVGGCNCQISKSSMVRVIGDNVVWYSSCGLDTEIVPGISRRVNDNRTEKEVYRLIFWQPGLFVASARTENGTASVMIEERNGMYLFGEAGMPVAAITERITEAEWIPPHPYELEPVFKTTFFEGVDSEGFRLMVLSFPALRFY